MVIPPGAQDAVRTFYGEVLGLEEKQPPRSLAHLHLVWFAAGEGEMELHFLPDPTRPINGTSVSWWRTWKRTGTDWLRQE
jgi:hypothetical protein